MTRTEQRDEREGRKGRIVRLLQQGARGISDIHESVHVSAYVARKLLGELRKAGKVECSGLGPDATWRAIV